MANTDAVQAVCDAIVHILTSSMEEQKVELRFDTVKPKFKVYTSEDFTNTGSARKITSGASVFLYRVLANTSHRTPTGRLLPDGRRSFNKLPLDLHLIVTIWGADPGTQNRLVGWVLRTLEDYRVIPATVLNIDSNTPVFEDNEAVELMMNEMSNDELLQLWDMLGKDQVIYQISIPYIARRIDIDSHLAEGEAGPPVQIRMLDMRRISGGG